jgi:hypothetical protein
VDLAYPSLLYALAETRDGNDAIRLVPYSRLVIVSSVLPHDPLLHRT